MAGKTDGKSNKQKDGGKEDAKSTSQKMKARAVELHKGILARRDQNRRGPLEDGWDAAEMKRGNLWVYLGYDDETAYRQAVNIGRSTWFRYRRLAEGLCKLAKEEFLKLIAENADHLIKLPENRRYDKNLLKKAQTLTEEEFEKLVIKFTAKADRVEEGEVIVSFKLRMPESRREFILETFKEFAEKMDVDPEDHSRILELLCAEMRQRNPIVTAVSHVLPFMGDTLKLLNGGRNNLSADETLKKIHGDFARHVKDLCKAVGHDPSKFEKPAAAESA
jgi:hypothetical protein